MPSSRGDRRGRLTGGWPTGEDDGRGDERDWSNHHRRRVASHIVVGIEGFSAELTG